LFNLTVFNCVAIVNLAHFDHCLANKLTRQIYDGPRFSLNDYDSAGPDSTDLFMSEQAKRASSGIKLRMASATELLPAAEEL
jgi:hypothetical protein